MPKYLIGIDEAGTGALAGPAYVGMVVIEKAKLERLPYRVMDSKMLKEQDIRALAHTIDDMCLAGVITATGTHQISVEEIEKDNPRKAVQNAIDSLLANLPDDLFDARIVADGNYPVPPKHKAIFKSVPKGDQLHKEVSAASILAKATRDAWMRLLQKQHTNFSFGLHKGYGTTQHMSEIRMFGPIVGVHRFTYKPVKEIADGIAARSAD